MTKASPPMPLAVGSRKPSAALAVIAASIAEPPRREDLDAPAGSPAGGRWPPRRARPRPPSGSASVVPLTRSPARTSGVGGGACAARACRRCSAGGSRCAAGRRRRGGGGEGQGGEEGAAAHAGSLAPSEPSRKARHLRGCGAGLLSGRAAPHGSPMADAHPGAGRHEPGRPASPCRAWSRQGCAVAALSRAPRPSAPGVQLDHRRPARPGAGAAAGAAAALSLSPIWLLPRGAAGAGRRPGVRRLIAFSSTSRFTKADSPEPAERAVAARLADGEARPSPSARRRGSPGPSSGRR